MDNWLGAISHLFRELALAAALTQDDCRAQFLLVDDLASSPRFVNSFWLRPLDGTEPEGAPPCCS